MRNSAKILLGLAILALVMGLAGCNGGGDSASDPGGNSSLVLRTYKVPDGRAVSVAAALNGILKGGKNTIGSASTATHGQILVLAPAAARAGGDGHSANSGSAGSAAGAGVAEDAF